MIRRCGIALLVLGMMPVSCATAAEKAKHVKVVAAADSEHGGYEAYRAMDGNPDTMWHTEFGSANPAHPHHIVFDLGKSRALSGLSYLPRPGDAFGKRLDRDAAVAARLQLRLDDLLSLPLANAARRPLFAMLDDVLGLLEHVLRTGL